MVQWLRSLTSTAGFQVRSLLSELRQWKLHHVVKKERKKKKKGVNLILQFKLDGLMKHSPALTSLSECFVPCPNTEVFREVLI